MKISQSTPANDTDATVTLKIDKKTQAKYPNLRVVLEDPDELFKKQVGGFVHFLREKAVVGLAVGFIIGQQAQGVIKQLVDSFINPWMNLLIGSRLQDRVGRVGGEVFAWGKFIYVFINFVFVILAIYIIMKLFKLDKLDLPKEKNK
ncbi:MscL family protein [Candidatus Saccharibacteria bacterium]|jgi:large-conductance mechanosensitive channel|nr:MscL family protein [Candidatus Saccharibacteria bacterium]HPR09294.1 MscL family protein [Candidatus Saccharibacteria bacterium]